MNDVTQWFPMSNPPRRAGWYEVKKGGVIAMAKWSRNSRMRIWRFNRFESFKILSPLDKSLFFDYILSEVTEWRGLAEKPV